MLNEPDEYGMYGESTEARCECEADDDAGVNESVYELNETTMLARARPQHRVRVRRVRRERQRVAWDPVGVQPGGRVYTTRAKRKQQPP